MVLGKPAQQLLAGLGGRGGVKIKVHPQGQHLVLLHEARQDRFQPRVKGLGAAGQVDLGHGGLGGRADGVLHEPRVVANRRGQCGHVLRDSGAVALQPPLDGLEDRAAADRADRRKAAEDERIARPGHDRPFHAELHDVRGIAAEFARLQRIEQGIDLARAGMELQFGAALSAIFSSGRSRNRQTYISSGAK